MSFESSIELSVADWDPPTPRLSSLDADVAAIARWAAEQEAQPLDEASLEDESTLSTTPSSASGSDTAPPVSTHSKRRKEDREPRPRRVRKPRRSTYSIQKEQKSALHDEIRMLEARLELLQVRAGLPTDDDQRSLVGVQTDNMTMEETIHANLITLSKSHSMLSAYMHSMSVGPLSTYIHLPKDLEERRATLRVMRDTKLRRARDVVTHRLSDADNTTPYATEERFIEENGIYHCKRFEILPFPEAKGVAPIFQALIMFLTNMGPTLQMQAAAPETLREDMDLIDPAIWHHRIVTAVPPVELELHIVGFARLEKENVDDDEPMGIIAADSVNVDDLYPYKPNERVRKDVTAAISVRSEPLRDDPTRRIVVIRRSTFLQLHPTPFVLPKAVEEELQTHIADWCRALNAFVRDTINGT